MSPISAIHRQQWRCCSGAWDSSHRFPPTGGLPPRWVVADEVRYVAEADPYVSHQMCDVVIAGAQSPTRKELELLDSETAPHHRPHDHRRRDPERRRRFRVCYGPLVAPPCSAFTLDSSPAVPDQSAILLPSLLAVTRTSLTPAGDEELSNAKNPHSITSRCHSRFCRADERSRLALPAAYSVP